MDVLVQIIDALIPILVMLIFFGLPMTFFFILKWRKMGLEFKNNPISNKMEDKINLIVEQNEDLKEELEQMRLLLGVDKQKALSLDIERYRQKNEQLTDYEKEQIRIDEQDKFNY